MDLVLLTVIGIVAVALLFDYTLCCVKAGPAGGLAARRRHGGYRGTSRTLQARWYQTTSPERGRPDL